MIQVRFARNAYGQRIAYVDEGDGPLVLLPAWWVSHLERDAEDPAYRQFFDRLTSKLRIVRYDRIGVGLSDRERKAFTLESELADFSAVVDHLGATQFHLLGFSCGGPIALAYAAEHPDRVQRIALYGSYLNGGELASNDVRDALIGLVRASGHLGARTLADIFHPTADADGRRRFDALQRASAEPDTAACLLELTYRLDARPFVDRVRAPVLVLHRKDDATIRHAQARELSTHLANATQTTLAGTAHMPWHGDSDALADAILGFLAGAPARQPRQPHAELRRDGEVWRLSFDGRQALLRDSKGLADLVHLLARPGEDVHVLDLYGAEPSERRDDRRGAVTFDRQALAAYRQRLADIDRDLQTAEAHADLGRVEKLAAERAALLRQLASDTGKRGRARRLNDPVERARKAVTARLREAIKRIAAADPALGAHLEAAIQTGVYCAYRPARPVGWVL